MNTELIKKYDIEKIVDEGNKIYETIKGKYEPDKNGKFLAIDADTKKVYFGNTSAEAMDAAKKDQPDKIFYLKKIGYDAVETIARMLH